jgi:hypothetical protein
MSEHRKIELTSEQISILMQIINKTSVIGEQVEIIANLKQTLAMMSQQKQAQ